MLSGEAQIDDGDRHGTAQRLAAGDRGCVLGEADVVWARGQRLEVVDRTELGAKPTMPQPLAGAAAIIAM
jgi:hypothetical protein